jgi:glucokinase-like ROK family protein
VNDSNGEAALELVYQLVEKLIKAATSPILGIGIGAPGLMNPEQGIVRKSVSLEWQDLPLRNLLETRYSLPVYIANDSQVAALAEYTFGGSSQKTSSLVVVKIGRGVGAGIVIDGQLHYGDGYGAGEIGHVMVVENGERCLCGHLGCLETVISSRAIISRAKTIAQSNPASSLHNFVDTPEAITTDIVLEAFNTGDTELQEAVAELGRYLAISVANLVGVLSIRHVLIGGSLARFGETLVEPMRQEIRQRVQATQASETCVNIATLGTDIVILGAASLLLNYELGLV